METESQQALEQETAQAEVTEPPKRALQGVDHAALAKLLRKRLEKFLSLVPGVLAGDNPEAVHDVRVWSRRLQQCLSALFPKPRPGRVRRLRRVPRRVRRLLGEWRNCDVVLKLVVRQQRRARSQAKRRAWGLVREHLLVRRSDQVARARHRLVREYLADLSERAHKLIDLPPEESSEAFVTRLRSGVEAAWGKWQSALALAQESHEASNIHAFRIATKGLRYRMELLCDLGDTTTKPVLNWLRELQEALGSWNDRQVLNQAIAEGIARPEFLLSELDAARILLAELEKARIRQGTMVEEIFRLAADHPGRQQMEAWVSQ